MGNHCYNTIGDHITSEEGEALGRNIFWKMGLLASSLILPI